MSRISPPFPERVGFYELLAPIGAGGMATVYLGLAELPGSPSRQVAVKMIHGTAETDSHLAADLLREARLVARIRHPNVVSMLDVGEDVNGLFLVMEYIEGDNLAGLRRAARRMGEQVPNHIGLRIITDALAGLHAAHGLKDDDGADLGLVHRDFSPQNILVGTDGVSRLTDFGIAKVAMTAGHTRTGKIKGKIAYMAPEQARGVKVDQRCDVWAAGVVTWEVLAGKRLYETDDEIGALLKIVNEDPPRLRTVKPELSLELDEAVAAALTRGVDDRCPTADQLRLRLLDAHPVAEISEVADFVRRVVGPKLVEREHRILEIRRARSKIIAIPPSVTAPGTSAPTERAPRTTASGADATPGDANVFESAVARVREDTTSATIAWKASERPAENSSERSGAIAPVQTISQTISWALQDRRRRAAVVGVASGLGLGVIVLSAVLVAGSHEKHDSTGASPTGSTPVLPAAESVAPVVPSDIPAEPLSALPTEPVFVVHTNAELSGLKIGSDNMAFFEGSKDVELGSRPATGTIIEATSRDGRKARGTIRAESHEITLTFPPPKRGGVIYKPPSTGNTTPFADNPYKKK